MRRPLGGLVCILLILAITTISWKADKFNKHNIDFKRGFSARELLEKYISNIYESAHLQGSGLGLDVFDKAVTGFMNLKATNKLPQTSSILTIVDLTKSSHAKRMWIIDMLNNELLINTWVSHGHGSGDDMATSFSNKIDSHQSSLGFYITDDVYNGKNGRSLRLDGMDAGFNSNARERAIVVHGAEYVGENAIDQIGRLGRSLVALLCQQRFQTRLSTSLKIKQLCLLMVMMAVIPQSFWIRTLLQITCSPAQTTVLWQAYNFMNYFEFHDFDLGHRPSY
jgi:hypothetical protein